MPIQSRAQEYRMHSPDEEADEEEQVTVSPEKPDEKSSSEESITLRHIDPGQEEDLIPDNAFTEFIIQQQRKVVSYFKPILLWEGTLDVVRLLFHDTWLFVLGFEGSKLYLLGWSTISYKRLGAPDAKLLLWKKQANGIEGVNTALVDMAIDKDRLFVTTPASKLIRLRVSGDSQSIEVSKVSDLWENVVSLTFAGEAARNSENVLLVSYCEEKTFYTSKQSISCCWLSKSKGACSVTKPESQAMFSSTIWDEGASSEKNKILGATWFNNSSETAESLVLFASCVLVHFQLSPHIQILKTAELFQGIARRMTDYCFVPSESEVPFLWFKDTESSLWSYNYEEDMLQFSRPNFTSPIFAEASTARRPAAFFRIIKQFLSRSEQSNLKKIEVNQSLTQCACLVRGAQYHKIVVYQRDFPYIVSVLQQYTPQAGNKTKHLIENKSKSHLKLSEINQIRKKVNSFKISEPLRNFQIVDDQPKTASVDLSKIIKVYGPLQGQPNQAGSLFQYVIQYEKSLFMLIKSPSRFWMTELEKSEAPIKWSMLHEKSLTVCYEGSPQTVKHFKITLESTLAQLQEVNLRQGIDFHRGIAVTKDQKVKEVHIQIRNQGQSSSKVQIIPSSVDLTIVVPREFAQFLGEMPSKIHVLAHGRVLICGNLIFILNRLQKQIQAYGIINQEMKFQNFHHLRLSEIMKQHPMNVFLEPFYFEGYLFIFAKSRTGTVSIARINIETAFCHEIYKCRDNLIDFQLFGAKNSDAAGEESKSVSRLNSQQLWPAKLDRKMSSMSMISNMRGQTDLLVALIHQDHGLTIEIIDNLATSSSASTSQKMQAQAGAFSFGLQNASNTNQVSKLPNPSDLSVDSVDNLYENAPMSKFPSNPVFEDAGKIPSKRAYPWKIVHLACSQGATVRWQDDYSLLVIDGQQLLQVNLEPELTSSNSPSPSPTPLSEAFSIRRNNNANVLVAQGFELDFQVIGSKRLAWVIGLTDEKFAEHKDTPSGEGLIRSEIESLLSSFRMTNLSRVIADNSSWLIPSEELEGSSIFVQKCLKSTNEFILGSLLPQIKKITDSKAKTANLTTKYSTLTKLTDPQGETLVTLFQPDFKDEDPIKKMTQNLEPTTLYEVLKTLMPMCEREERQRIAELSFCSLASRSLFIDPGEGLERLSLKNIEDSNPHAPLMAMYQADPEKLNGSQIAMALIRHKWKTLACRYLYTLFAFQFISMFIIIKGWSKEEAGGIFVAVASICIATLTIIRMNRVAKMPNLLASEALTLITTLLSIVCSFTVVGDTMKVIYVILAMFSLLSTMRVFSSVQFTLLKIQGAVLANWPLILLVGCGGYLAIELDEYGDGDNSKSIIIGGLILIALVASQSTGHLDESELLGGKRQRTSSLGTPSLAGQIQESAKNSILRFQIEQILLCDIILPSQLRNSKRLFLAEVTIPKASSPAHYYEAREKSAEGGSLYYSLQQELNRIQKGLTQVLHQIRIQDFTELRRGTDVKVKKTDEPADKTPYSYDIQIINEEDSAAAKSFESGQGLERAKSLKKPKLNFSPTGMRSQHSPRSKTPKSQKSSQSEVFIPPTHGEKPRSNFSFEIMRKIDLINEQLEELKQSNPRSKKTSKHVESSRRSDLQSKATSRSKTSFQQTQLLPDQDHEKRKSPQSARLNQASSHRSTILELPKEEPGSASRRQQQSVEELKLEVQGVLTKFNQELTRELKAQLGIHFEALQVTLQNQEDKLSKGFTSGLAPVLEAQKKKANEKEQKNKSQAQQVIIEQKMHPMIHGEGLAIAAENLAQHKYTQKQIETLQNWLEGIRANVHTVKFKLQKLENAQLSTERQQAGRLSPKPHPLRQGRSVEMSPKSRKVMTGQVSSKNQGSATKQRTQGSGPIASNTYRPRPQGNFTQQPTAQGTHVAPSMSGPVYSRNHSPDSAYICPIHDELQKKIQKFKDLRESSQEVNRPIDTILRNGKISTTKKQVLSLPSYQQEHTSMGEAFKNMTTHQEQILFTQGDTQQQVMPSNIKPEMNLTPDPNVVLLAAASLEKRPDSGPNFQSQSAASQEIARQQLSSPDIPSHELPSQEMISNGIIGSEVVSQDGQTPFYSDGANVILNITKLQSYSNKAGSPHPQVTEMVSDMSNQDLNLLDDLQAPINFEGKRVKREWQRIYSQAELQQIRAKELRERIEDQ